MSKNITNALMAVIMLFMVCQTAQAERIWMTAGGHSFPVTLEDNATATAFMAFCPTTLAMTELNNNEKYHNLDTTLPTNASCPGTIQAGDIMLYNDNCIVVFYKTFATTYNYTKIGHIDDVTNLADALGTGDVSVSFKNDLKVVLFSDPHVMASELLVSEGEAWTNYLNADRKMVDYSKTLFDLMVSKIKTDIHPDLVLITGDLTKDGETVSHNYVKGKLDELTDAGIPTLIVMGNHDWGTSNAKYYSGSTTTPAPALTMSELATLYANYGFGSADREGSTLTYACEPIPGLVLIGIDSGSDGQLSSTTLTWVCDKAKAAYNSGKQVFAMMHHPLIPHFSGAASFAESVAIDAYATVRNALADAGVRVIFTGHFHTSDIAKDYNGDCSTPIYDVNTGSLISYPNDYRTITLAPDLLSTEITTSSISEITSGDGFADMAKTRLHTAAENMIKSKGAAYALIAGSAADAFIYHAEGDEADNEDAQTTLTTLISAGTSAKAFGYITESQFTALSDMANSMLKDLSNYGDTKREDKTPDRTLSISMPTLTFDITLANDGWSTYCSSQPIDLSQTEGVTGYIVSAVSSTSVTLQSVSIIPAETGFIINGGTGGQSYRLYATLNLPDDVSGNELIGTLAATPAPSNSYALSTRSDVTGFYPIKAGINIPAHKAYLVTASAAKSLTLDGEEEDVTGIKEYSSSISHSSNSFYTLQGIPVSHPTKGMYICGGRIIIIK